ncbi:MAG: ribosomal-protein-alanine N-acetyltransferase RimI [Thermoproteota archaeon]|uniref:N-acetyltransferase n=1 Tax=Candidatus Methanodesulfokora washburnensis TaxID=2478471 RepID=A0A429GQ32_9CREN|nr:N-acetyltransferase [Candidatus Methanodesulfokores washburnensis]RSN75975.1 N-acetyltransferase [Candidatus Methanodesulfokores washburnensis]RZN62473.1 MAG: N-acetyltransferase [Candidatus Methanodesulfokores washburnensis]TDA39337.1 MAG: ribosomal-protein-alanine N-acetyltransferase RimI [Candidatus Korarchaeota archaeon]
MISLVTQKTIFKIRFYRPEDIDQVQRLNRVFLPEHYPPYFFDENFRRFPKAFIVAEGPSGILVGYVMCRVERGFTRGGMFNMGHILSIAVDKGFRRMGIGTSLMLEAEKNLVNEYRADLIYLEVRVSNEPAINLYKKLGYDFLGVMPSYYHDGEDGYLMYKITSAKTSKSDVMALLGDRIE